MFITQIFFCTVIETATFIVGGNYSTTKKKIRNSRNKKIPRYIAHLQ
jgi:hypothetical protein